MSEKIDFIDRSDFPGELAAHVDDLDVQSFAFEVTLFLGDEQNR